MVCILTENVIQSRRKDRRGEDNPMAIKRKFPVRVATVYCNGGCRAKRDDRGMLCKYGCVACEACINACRFGAICLSDYGIAEVDEEKCIGCGACARACPKKLIRIRIQDNSILPLCSNKDKGFDPKTKTGARTQCDVSCIACGLCVKKCPSNAITIAEQHAVIDEALCLNCGLCATVCPRHVIVDRRGIVASVR